eukprot:TRINITY_DN6314_c0_g1_i1.p2 TRINITY_DN6314_c0_g1~~TRINITY_DN6314_c0_g1_i1.p2  ORF type:complete len:115 (-),score=22.04 TRINITY_DN6314_c0_g1_i1:412-756(-)
MKVPPFFVSHVGRTIFPDGPLRLATLFGTPVTRTTLVGSAPSSSSNMRCCDKSPEKKLQLGNRGILNGHRLLIGSHVTVVDWRGAEKNTEVREREAEGWSNGEEGPIVAFKRRR